MDKLTREEGNQRKGALSLLQAILGEPVGPASKGRPAMTLRDRILKQILKAGAAGNARALRMLTQLQQQFAQAQAELRDAQTDSSHYVPPGGVWVVPWAIVRANQSCMPKDGEFGFDHFACELTRAGASDKEKS